MCVPAQASRVSASHTPVILGEDENEQLGADLSVAHVAPSPPAGFLQQMLESVLDGRLRVIPPLWTAPADSPPVTSGEAARSTEMITAKEAACLFHVHRTTLYRWAKAGKIDTTLTLGGHRRYLRRDIEKLLASHFIPPAKSVSDSG